MVHSLELGARVLEENLEIAAPQETWGQKVGDPASGRGHWRCCHCIIGSLWVSALQQGASTLIPQQSTLMGQESPGHGLLTSHWSGRGGTPHNNWMLIINRMALLSRGSM